jgi:hypothetical protein
MLVEVEQFVLVKEGRLLYRAEEYVHHSLIHIEGCHIAGVDQECNAERVILQTNGKQFNHLFMAYGIFGGTQKLFIVVFLAVHFKYDVDILGRCQESLSVILGHARLHVIIDDDLFIVCLVILPVGG